jgi:hypothetical protein
MFSVFQSEEMRLFWIFRIPCRGSLDRSAKRCGLVAEHDFVARRRIAAPGRPGWSPTQDLHRSGRGEQTAHLVTPGQTLSTLPIIGLPALLRLVEWYQERRRKTQQGGLSCPDLEPPLSPARRGNVSRQPIPHRLWVTFPVERRERILSTLTHVVAQQLAKPTDLKEVTHECS